MIHMYIALNELFDENVTNSVHLMMPHSVNNNALMQLELPGMRTEWAEL